VKKCRTPPISQLESITLYLLLRNYRRLCRFIGCLVRLLGMIHAFNKMEGAAIKWICRFICGILAALLTTALVWAVGGFLWWLTLAGLSVVRAHRHINLKRSDSGFLPARSKAGWKGHQEICMRLKPFSQPKRKEFAISLNALIGCGFYSYFAVLYVCLSFVPLAYCLINAGCCCFWTSCLTAKKKTIVVLTFDELNDLDQVDGMINRFVCRSGTLSAVICEA